MHYALDYSKFLTELFHILTSFSGGNTGSISQYGLIL